MSSVAAARARASSLALLFAACSDTALVLEVRSDLEVDGLCLSVAAVDATGDDEAFARRYAVTTDWPQTLTVLAGAHDEVQVWARASLGGIERARAGARTSFEGGSVKTVGLDLLACPGVVAGASPTVRDMDGAAFSLVAAPVGWRGVQIVAFGDGVGARWIADGTLVARGDVPSLPVPFALLVADVDGDCDDDLVLSNGEPHLLRQAGDGSFVDEGALPLAVGDALAAADVDRDGDVDLVVAGGAIVRLYRNDGTGRFQEDGAAIPGGVATDATALAMGDVNGDGHPDLFVGQGGGPIRLLLDDAAGSGSFELAPGVLPAVGIDVVAAEIADLDGDLDSDLVVVGAGEPPRLYVNRGDGRLEDRSFVRLPQVGPIAASGVSAGDFDGDCHADLLITRSTGAPLLWRGTDPGLFEDTPIGADGVHGVLADADGDARPDLLLAGPQGVTWVAPR